MVVVGRRHQCLLTTANNIGYAAQKGKLQSIGASGGKGDKLVFDAFVHCEESDAAIICHRNRYTGYTDDVALHIIDRGASKRQLRVRQPN